MSKRWTGGVISCAKLLATGYAIYRALNRYERLADPAALERAIALLRRMLITISVDHPWRAPCLALLGEALGLRYERVTTELDDLHEAVSMARQAAAAIPTDHPDRSSYLCSLGLALHLLGEHTQQLEDLTEAVTIGRQAVAATSAHDPGRAANLASLGVSLQLLYERTQKLEDLTEAVAIGRQAVAAARANDPSRSKYLNNLGGALQLLSQRTQKLEDLTETVIVGRQAVAATPIKHPSRAINLGNLGVALQQLYEQTQELTLLLEAASVGRQAVAATPSKHPGRATYLNNLGSTLWQLYMRIGDLRLLNEAVTAQREAVAAIPPGHPYRAGYMSNLGITLSELFERTTEPALLNEAVTAQRQAVAAIPADHPDQARYLNALGLALRLLFDQTKQLAVLTEAVNVYRRAVAATPADHADRAGYQNNLGLALWRLFEETNELAPLTEAREVLTNAVNSPVAALMARINAGRGLGRVCMAVNDARTALSALESVVALVPQIAPRAFRRSDREYGLSQLAGLSTEVAAAATAAGQPERAIELLEQTRGILMGEAIDARSDLTELRRAVPNLAADFDKLREHITGLDDIEPGLVPLYEHPTIGWPNRTMEALQRRSAELAERRRSLAKEWIALLERIRATPGFDQFLLPPSISHLCRQAVEGPIIIVYASRWRSDSLIITPNPVNPVQVVPLSSLTDTVAAEHARQLLEACAAADKSAEGSDDSAWSRSQDKVQELLRWLWDTISGPILTHLHLSSKSEQWPRIWWCPIGVCVNLPLHAAGHHTAISNTLMPSTVMDRVTSSYTPTIRALEYARARRESSRGAADSALIVAMPATPGASDLPEATAEAQQLTQLLRSPHVLIGSAANYQAVTEALPRYGIAHFACHGLSNRINPAASKLLLFDHIKRPLTITALSRLQLATAELAYLSACSTTQTNVVLADEAVHITAAFQLAGYRQVIGTLWPIKDVAANIIAKYFYANLTDRGTHRPRVNDSAVALARAIRHVRDASPAVPTQWAAHIHFGA